MYKVEVGHPDEYKEVYKILWRAFEIENKFDEEKREPGDWWSKEGYSRSYVIKDNSKIVANMTLEQLPARIRGADIVVVGIGAVATEPEFRRKRMIRALFKTAFQSMKESGEVFSMLDPFKIDYYRKFGYANAETLIQYSFTASNIIRLKVSDGINVREAIPDDEQILMDLQQTALKEGSKLYLTKDNISKRIKSQNCYVVEEDGKPAGWFKLYFHRDKTEIDWENQQLTMTVSLGLFYNNHNILNGIFDFLSKFEDQVDLIRINCAIEVPVPYYIEDRHKLKIDTKGSMMIRVIDLNQYINAITIPKSAESSVILNLQDEHCPWNSGTYKFVPKDGRLTIEKVDTKPDVSVTDQQFSRIVSGLNSIITLQNLGIIDCTIEVARKLENIFPKDGLMSYLRF